MVFDHRLGFEFDSIPISWRKSYFEIIPFNADSQVYLCGVSTILESDSIPDKIFLISSTGEILLEKEFEKVNPSAKYRAQVFSDVDNRKLYYLRNDGLLFRLNRNLELNPYRKLKYLTNTIHSYMDLNSNGNPEHVFKKFDESRWIFTDLRFRHPVEWSSGWIPSNVTFSPKLNGNENPTLFIQSENNCAEIAYVINPFWYWQYLLYAAIWGFIYLLILLISRIQRAKIRQQMLIQEQMNELQYRVITAQFSPHYTFNVLNTISAGLFQTNPEMYNYLTKFTRQLRYLYAGKNELSRSLNEELTFCTDYLDIQKLRFGSKFDYNVRIGPDVDGEISVPKMLVFTFAENALKHGLRPFESGGRIEISVRNLTAGTVVEITDNGIGRQAAEEYLKGNPGYSTGRGLELLNEFITLYNKGRKGKIEIETKDLFDGDKAAGISVMIRVAAGS